MAGDVSHAPSRRRTAARKLRRNVHDGHEGKLHPAERLWLVKAEQAALVQKLLVVANEHAGVLGALGALAQDRHDLPRPPHRLLIPNPGEITMHELRQRARLVLSARLRGHGKNLLPQPASSATARAASAMARCA